MTLISQTLPSLINGVSQQPAVLRLQSQCEAAENTYMTVIKGVTKRPPFRHFAKVFSDTGHDNDFVQTINRSTSERYQVFVSNGDLKVFSLIDGTQKTVNFPSGKGYLSAANPRASFVALTIADYTFLVNKNVTVQRSGSVSPTTNKDALVYVRQGSYSTTYSIALNGTGVASYTSADGSDATTDTPTVQTDYIANQLISQLNANSFVTDTWNITGIGSSIYIQAKSGGVDFTMTTQDGLGDKALVAIKDNLQSFSDLPQVAPNGYQVRIIGDSTDAFDDYFVTYQAPTGTASGHWTETTAQGVDNDFNASTMPWQLIRNGDGTFTCTPASWPSRGCGDDTSAPAPSFIGQGINAVFFWQNRLGFLAGQNVIMSKAGYFFTFWPDTVTQQLDSDRIDIAVSSAKVSILNAAATYAQDLYLFSDQSQFSMSGANLLTPKSVSVLPVTEYENTTSTCQPISLTRHIYFVMQRGAFSALREINTLPVSDTVDATEITDHVPTYIAGNIFKLAGSSNEDVLACLEGTNRNFIYIYKYYFSQDTKLQSCWSKWILDPGDVVLNVDFIQTDMYATIQRSDGVYLETASIELGRQDVGFPFQVNLDRRVYGTGAYNATTNTTSWTLPYVVTGGTFEAVLGPGFVNPNLCGKVLALSSTVGSSVVSATGNFAAQPVYIGRAYTKRFRPSPQYVRRSKDAPSITEGRLQLNRMSVVYQDTGYFRAEVTPLARDTAAYPFSGLFLGNADSVVGSRPTPSGTFKFPVMSDGSTVTIDLINDTYLPSAFQQIGWEAKYYIRSTSLS